MSRSIRIALGLLAAVAVVSGRPASAASYTNTIAQMTAYITNQMASGNVQGLSIAIVDGQDVVWAAGFGYADAGNGVAADADTVYHIGSCSKSFLGTLYMQLRDQGRVNLEAPLTNYIAEFSMLPRFTNSEPVTIRSLLNHHSGIPGDFFNGMITMGRWDGNSQWLIDYLQGDYPFMPVNQRSMYCNSGFSMLTEAAARITGSNFSAAADAMIFSRMGMDASSYYPDKAAISNRMAAAYNSAGELQPPEFLNALGSGSMYSSANDLAKYIRMILANGQWQGQSIVSSNGIDVMTEPQLTNLPLNVTDEPQGLGWDNADDYRFRYAGKAFWKDGATWFHCGFIEISRDLQLGVAVIQNTPGNACDDIGAEALRWAILDKTITNHWPTNTFVPTPSPVTNRPQAELDVLAGLYVGSAGYHKIVTNNGALTLVANANSDTPIITSNLVPRANGWFSKTNSQDNQIAFTNLAGHAMLVLHQVSGAFEVDAPLGEQYLPGPLSAAWAARTNRVYRMVDLYPADYFWYPGQPYQKTLRFTIKDSALMTSWMLGQYVIQPTNDNLAFQRGTHYRKGGAVQVSVTNGYELLKYSSYRFLDEAAIPTLAVSTITNGAIPFANGTQWYWFDGSSGVTYRARVTAGGQEAFARITDREGIPLNGGTGDSGAWTCASNGTYAIAVSATNVLNFDVSLAVEDLVPLTGDFDGDGKADPALYVATPSTSSGQGGTWYVRLSASGYVLATLAGFGGDGYSACIGDYDADGKADPAVYQATPSTGSTSSPQAGFPLREDATVGQAGQGGNWYVKLSGSGYAMVSLLGFGGAFCEAVAGDYDGDGKADPATYNGTNGDWRVAMSSLGYSVASVSGMGGTNYTAVAANYDSDHRYDAAVYNDLNGNWTVLLSANNYITATLWGFGGETDMPVQGDFDGDGLNDPAIYRESKAQWTVKLSGSGYAAATLRDFGGPAAYVAAADYDGDFKADPICLDGTTGLWHVKLSASGYAEATLASGYIP